MPISTWITGGARYVYPRVGEWVTQRAIRCSFDGKCVIKRSSVHVNNIIGVAVCYYCLKNLQSFSISDRTFHHMFLIVWPSWQSNRHHCFKCGCEMSKCCEHPWAVSKSDEALQHVLTFIQSLWNLKSGYKHIMLILQNIVNCKQETVDIPTMYNQWYTLNLTQFQLHNTPNDAMVIAITELPIKLSDILLVFEIWKYFWDMANKTASTKCTLLWTQAQCMGF